MGRKKSYGKSRRVTPWDDLPKTPTEQFLYEHDADHYKQKHPALIDAHEADMVNSYVPKTCPNCGSTRFSLNGKDDIGIQRFICNDCGKRFKPTTGTIFDSRRTPISEWMEYCLNIFRYVSINADSWNNANFPFN